MSMETKEIYSRMVRYRLLRQTVSIELVVLTVTYIAFSMLTARESFNIAVIFSAIAGSVFIMHKDQDSTVPETCYLLALFTLMEVTRPYIGSTAAATLILVLVGIKNLIYFR